MKPIAQLYKLNYTIIFDFDKQFFRKFFHFQFFRFRKMNENVANTGLLYDFFKKIIITKKAIYLLGNDTPAI